MADEPNGTGGAADGAGAPNAGAGAPAGAGTPAAASGTAGTPGTPASGTPGQADTRTSATSGNGFDPKDFIPRHRFNEISTRARTLEAQLEETNRKVAALMGVTPPDANTAKAEQVKDAFFALPGMARLRKFLDLPDEKFNALLEAPDAVAGTREAELRSWQRHGDQQIEHIASGVADALGVETLDAQSKTEMRVLFSDWLKRKASAEIEERGQSQSLARYENGDAKLLDEFVGDYTKRWVDPARRTSAARTVNRTRPVPSSAGRSQVSSIQRPEKFNSLDDRIAYAAELAKERGVSFGR